MRFISALLFTSLAVIACGDDDNGAKDTTSAADTQVQGDTSATTTTTPDATTSEDDTAIATTEEDTSVAPDTTTDTQVIEVVQTTCGCGSDGSCLQAKTPEACASLGPSCSSPQELLDACKAEDFMASCERSNTIQYLYFERIEDWIKNLADACASTLTGAAGTLTIATIPEPVGAVCSCQRTAASCVQVYGATCDNFACDTGLQTTECASANRIPGRCVTQDGQRELFFYSPGANLDNAESSCLGASATEYYWFPEL